MNKNICICGDSIVQGHCDYVLGGWAQQLKNDFAQHDLHSVYELGVGGDTTTDLCKRCESEMRVRDANFVIFAIGINDAAIYNGKARVSIDEFKQNIMKLINIGKLFSHDVVFIGLTPVVEEKTMPVEWDKNLHYTNANIAQYDMMIQQIVQKNTLSYISMQDVITAADLSDGVHPSVQGHAKMYKRIKEFLIKK